MKQPSSGWLWKCFMLRTYCLWTPMVRHSSRGQRWGCGWGRGDVWLTMHLLGLSDPFVIVELGPPHLFPLVRSQRTQVKARTLHPVYDELFHL